MTETTGFSSAAVSDRGLSEARPENEDSYLVMRDFGIFVVADGVGGAQAGEVASQMAVEIVGEAFANMRPDADAEETMRIALERANDAIYQMSQDLPQLASMATTIVALHLGGDIATIGHVGDSRIYRVDAAGRLFRETDDHSVVEEEVRAGRMTAEQALNHPSRNVISRALGAEYNVEADIKCVLAHPATTFLLCSDGITRHITDAEIESLLAFGGEPDEICARMKEICYSRGAEDNLTAVIVSLPGERRPFGHQDDDIEEVTVAGVRPVSVDAPETGAPNLEVQELSGASPSEQTEPDHLIEPILDVRTEPLEPARDEDSYLIEDPGPVTNSGPASYEAPSEVRTSSETANPGGLHAYTDVGYAPPHSSIGRVLSMIGILIAGIIVGAAGSYFLFPANPPVVEAPVITEQKSNNVPMTTFEETRRLVDADPVRYLNANAASPQEADDYFWLGRALLLTGKPVEAKRAFEQAKQRLPLEQDADNLRTMTNEIAMGLIVTDNPAAVEALSKEVAPASSPVNANAGNVSIPFR